MTRAGPMDSLVQAGIVKTKTADGTGTEVVDAQAMAAQVRAR